MEKALKELNILYLDKDNTITQNIRDNFGLHFNNLYISNSPEHTINFFKN